MTATRATHFQHVDVPTFWPARTKEAHEIGDRVVSWERRDYVKRDPLIRSKRYIAAEIEVVTASQHAIPSPIDQAVQRWKAGIVHDGSLGMNGFEINTAPAMGPLFTAQINDICSALAVQNAEVNQSCGCHFHVDARDFKWYEIKRLIMLYSIIEPALYSIVPEHRRVSRYCYPCGQRFLQHVDAIVPRGAEWKDYTVRKHVKVDKGRTIEIEQEIQRMETDVHRLRQAVVLAVYDRQFKDKGADTVKQDKRGQHRYRALNLHSWFHRGTIEWRLPEGLLTTYEITSWAALLSRIMDISYTETETQIKEYMGSVNWNEQISYESQKQSISLLCTLVPECRSWIEARVNLYRHMSDPIPRLRRQVGGSDPSIVLREALRPQPPGMAQYYTSTV